jgi:hypothetical protein
MKLHALYLVAAVIATALSLSAGAVPSEANHEVPASARQATSATHTCPPGYYWEPDAYAPHGKFRPAHCAPRW